MPVGLIRNLIIPVIILIYTQVYASPLHFKSFVTGQTIWSIDTNTVTYYDGNARKLNKLVLNPTQPKEKIFDAIEDESSIWIISKSGIYQIPFTTATVEKIPTPFNDLQEAYGSTDQDYFWCFTNNKLWRFDKLSREWIDFTPEKQVDIRGVVSDGTNVFCFSSESVIHFSIIDEKWYYLKNPKIRLAQNTPFIVNKSAISFINKQSISRFQFYEKSWNQITTNGEIRDTKFFDTAAYFIAGDQLYHNSFQTGSTRKHEITGITQINSFTVIDTNIIIADKKGLIQFDPVSKSTERIEYPPAFSSEMIVKIFTLGTKLILLTKEDFFVFDNEIKTWTKFSRMQASSNQKILSWNDNGLKLQIGNYAQTELKGSIYQDFKFQQYDSIRIFKADSITVDSIYSQETVPQKDTIPVLYIKQPNPLANLTLHTQFSGNRFSDIYFNNVDPQQKPQKSFYYRGNNQDIVSSIKAGSNNSDNSFRSLPSVLYEGVNTIFESPQTIQGGTRKIFRGQFDGGLILSKTISEIQSYKSDGIYTVNKDSTLDTSKTYPIIPGSEKIYIDGKLIDPSSYEFFPSIGTLLLRADLADPTSIIVISYSIQTLDESSLNRVEFIPENHFGFMTTSSGTLSPVNWFSGRLSYTSLDKDSSLGITSLASPIELRGKNQRYLLKINPEINYETKSKSQSSGVELLGSIRFFSIAANAFHTNRNFVSTDEINFGYGKISDQWDYNVKLDLLQQIPITFNQMKKIGSLGTEKSIQGEINFQFSNFPQLKFTGSKNELVTKFRPVNPIITKRDSIYKAYSETFKDSVEVRQPIFDTLNIDRSKTTFQGKLYEISSPLIEKLLHLYKFSYELSGTFYEGIKEGSPERLPGSVWYSQISASPINSLTFAGIGTFRNNPHERTMKQSIDIPVISFQTLDLPKGVDLALSWESHSKISEHDSIWGLQNENSDTISDLNIEQVRNLNLTLKPGTWLNELSIISLFGSLQQRVLHYYQKDRLHILDYLNLSEPVVKSVLLSEAGFKYFVTPEITFHHNDKFTTPQKGDSTRAFGSFNDLKWFYGLNNLWQTRFEFDIIRTEGINTIHNNRGYTRFDNVWIPWFKTSLGLSYRISEIDSSYDTTVFDSTLQRELPKTIELEGNLNSFGPEITAILTFENYGIFKSIQNTHDLKIYNVNETQIQTQVTKHFWEGSYSVKFRFVILPNISLASNNSIIVSRGKYKQYNGKLTLSALF